MSLLVPLIYFLIFLYVIQKANFFKIEEISIRQLWIFFSIKIFAGLTLWYIYSNHYTLRNTSDAFRYFDDAMIVRNNLIEKPLDFFKILLGYDNGSEYFKAEYYEKMSTWNKPYYHRTYNDNMTIIRLNMVFSLFSGGNYHVHTVLANVLSFIGLTAFLKGLKVFFKGKVAALACLVFLTPSLLFWGSGVLKESIMIFSFGMFFMSAFKLINRITIRYSFWLMVGFVGLALSKFYVLLALLPFLISYAIVRKFNFKIAYAYISVLTISSMLAFGFKYVHPKYDLPDIMMDKQKDFINTGIEWKANSLVEISRLDGTAWSMIKTIPEAIRNTLFRPYFPEATNAMMITCSVEIFLIIIFCFLCYYYKSSLKHININLFLLLLFYSLSMATLIGWVTPILGAVVRYKIALLPTLLATFLLIVNTERLRASFLGKHLLSKIEFLWNKTK